MCGVVLRCGNVVQRCCHFCHCSQLVTAVFVGYHHHCLHVYSAMLLLQIKYSWSVHPNKTKHQC